MPESIIAPGRHSVCNFCKLDEPLRKLGLIQVPLLIVPRFEAVVATASNAGIVDLPSCPCYPVSLLNRQNTGCPIQWGLPVYIGVSRPKATTISMLPNVAWLPL